MIYYSNTHQIISFDVSEGSTCVSVSSDKETDVVVWLADSQDRLVNFLTKVSVLEDEKYAYFKTKKIPS